jgi:uncharacterized protein YndB with AHSA1/START domain
VASYSFLTTWLLEAPREPVFEAIHDQERWPQWWRGVEEAEEIEPGDDDGVGSVSRLVWRSRLPYRVKFEVTTRRVERPHLMEGHAVGELTGVGRWRFFERGRGDGGALRVGRQHQEALDERPGADCGAGVRVESRLGDGARREGIAGLLGCRLVARG